MTHDDNEDMYCKSVVVVEGGRSCTEQYVADSLWLSNSRWCTVPMVLSRNSLARVELLLVLKMPCAMTLCHDKRTCFLFFNLDSCQSKYKIMCIFSILILQVFASPQSSSAPHICAPIFQGQLGDQQSLKSIPCSGVRSEHLSSSMRSSRRTHVPPLSALPSSCPFRHQHAELTQSRRLILATDRT